MSCHMASEWNDELSIHNGRPKCAKLRRAPRTCSELDLYSQPIDLKPNVNYTLGQQTWENIKEKRTSRIANTIYNNITENRRNVKILKKLMGWWMYDSSLHLRCNTIESEMFALKTHYNFHCHYYWGGGGEEESGRLQQTWILMNMYVLQKMQTLIPTNISTFTVFCICYIWKHFVQYIWLLCQWWPGMSNTEYENT